MKKIYMVLMMMCFLGVSVKAQEKSIDGIQTSTIEDVLAEINADSVEFFMQSLQDMGTRFLMAENRREVSMWIKNKFHSFGIEDVVIDSFECYTNINLINLHYDTTTWQYNVIATLSGTIWPEQISIICGHHDNVVVAPGGEPEVFAPGADDNASGTAAVLESARAIMASGHQPEATIRFITFAAEELMGFGDAGSEYYAPMAAANGDDIRMVINNDMIAWDEGDWTIGISNVIGSEDVTAIATHIASTYTTLNIDLWPPTSNGGADLKTFNEMGYKGVYLMEKDFNPYYHSEDDLVENCNIPYCTEVIKIACGSLIYRDITVGHSEHEIEAALHFYPNPAKDHIYIQHTGNAPFELSITDLNGRKMLHKQVSGKLQQIDLKDFAAGLYVLSCISDKKQFTDKLFVTN